MIKKKNISQKDINTWKNYIKNLTDITDKDDIQKDSQSNHSRFNYDLHGFTLLEANEKQSDLLRRFPSKEQVHKSESALILLLYFCNLNG